jgi:N-acetylneuraminic acid mutarotase
MRGWHLIPLAAILVILIVLPVAALTDTGLEHDVRKDLGLSTGECEPETNLASAWVEGPSLPFKIDEPRAAALEGDVYLVGGITGVEEEADGELVLEPSDALTRFDPSTGTFTELAPLPRPLNHSGVVTYDHDLYVFGGYGRSRTSDTSRGFWRYDPKSDRWTAMPEMPVPRAAMAAGVVGDQLIIAGGARDSEPYSEAFAFDFKSDKWRRLPDMLSKREHVGAAVVGDKLYVLGGRAPQSLAVDTAESYDVSAERWTALPPMLVGAGGLGTISAGGKVIAVGGGNDGAATVTAAVQEFDPQTSKWTFLSEMRTPAHGHATAVIDNRIWVFGGSPCPYYNATDLVQDLDLQGSGA